MAHAFDPESPPRTYALSSRAVVWLGLIGLLLRGIASQRAVDIDVFHQMALFREALARGALPDADVFAYTPTLDHVVDHEWGTGAVFYAVWEGAGWGAHGLSVLRYAVILSILVLSYAAARRDGATDAGTAIAAPVAMLLVATGLAPLRAQALTLGFLALLLLLLRIDRTGRRWWIPVWLACHVVWVNVHGGFVVGIGAVALCAAERILVAWSGNASLRVAYRQQRHLLLVLTGMVVLSFVNPYGARYVAYLARALTMQRPLIDEWAPLWDPRVGSGLRVAFAFSLVLLAYAVSRPHRGRADGLPFVIVAALATGFSQRHASVYGVAWFVVVAPLLSREELGRMVARSWSRYPRAVEVIGLLCAATGAWRTMTSRAWDLTLPQRAGQDAYFYPVGATDALAARGFSGNLLTRFEDGGYVSWRLFPAVKVSLDSRYEVAYQPGVVEDHVTFFWAQPGWEDVLSRYATDALLVPRTAPVHDRIGTSARTREWIPVYGDAAFSVFVDRGRAAASGRRTSTTTNAGTYTVRRTAQPTERLPGDR